jgi:hypothetical protein
MFQEQDKPSLFSVGSELQETNSYIVSFARCKDILIEIEAITDSRVVTYFSSFKHPTGIVDADAFLMEDLLRCKNNKKPLTLILSSPGGQAVAAEKIVQVCRSYAEVNNTSFFTIIPKSAKSAATIIALGSDKILMSKTAELGPIDPQIVATSSIEKGKKIEEETVGNKKTVKEEKILENVFNVIPAFRIIKSVEELLVGSRKFLNPGRAVYKRFLEQYGYDLYSMSKNEFKLSESILRKILDRKKKSSKIDGEFVQSCRIFFDPELTLSHNRPITFSDIEDSPLNKTGFIETYIDFYKGRGMDEEEIKKLDSLLWEYYARTNHHLEDDGNQIVKTIESQPYCFRVTAGGQSINF